MKILITVLFVCILLTGCEKKEKIYTVGLFGSNVVGDSYGVKIDNIWKASDYRYVAVSRDLLSRWGGPLEYGDWIVIEGAGKNSGVYQVRDTMNPKWTRRVDVLKTPGTRQFKYDNIVMLWYPDYTFSKPIIRLKELQNTG